MSSASTIPMDQNFEEGNESYRAISKAAILSLVFALASFAAFSIPALSVLALVGFTVGFTGYRNIRRYPDELSGKVAALVGTVACGIVFVSSVTWHSITYATEVPEGYERISFNDLQPVPEHPELPISPTALQLNGKKIFVKGYVYPDGQQTKIKRFVLVPDMGTCCFGGQPKLTHMMEVTLTDPHRINYSFQKRKLAGELTVDTSLKPVSGVGGVYFQLKAHYVK